MATSTPADPVQRMKDAATNAGGFGTVLDDLPQEVQDWDLFCMDPVETEDQSESQTTNAKNYTEQHDYVVYLATIRQDRLNANTKSNPSLTPRQHLNDQRDSYLEQLAADAEANGETGRYEKVRRTRLIKTIGTDEAFVDAITIRVTRSAQYQ